MSITIEIIKEICENMSMSYPLSQVGLIHGSGFEINNEALLLSPGSRANVDRAQELLDQRAIERIICSGRGPIEGIDYAVTEARLMADYLFNRGVSHNKIICEEESTSTVGNWAYSAPIIGSLGAESVLGITAKSNVKRMRLVGDFVASKCDFEVVSYAPSDAKAKPKDYARELPMFLLTEKFIHEHANTPVADLSAAYDAFKASFGLGALKRFIHRGSTKTLMY